MHRTSLLIIAAAALTASVVTIVFASATNNIPQQILQPISFTLSTIGISEGINTVNCQTRSCGQTCGKSVKNCSSTHGWKANFIHNDVKMKTNSSVVALVYEINGKRTCYARTYNNVQLPVVQNPFFWDYEVVGPTNWMASAVPAVNHRFTIGRYVMSLVTDNMTGNPLYGTVASGGNAEMLVSEWNTSSTSVLPDDPAIQLPKECVFALKQQARNPVRTIREVLQDHSKNGNSQKYFERARYHVLRSAAQRGKKQELLELLHKLEYHTPPAAGVDNSMFANPIRNQVAIVCGSCWAASSASLAELVLFKAISNPPPTTFNPKTGPFSLTNSWLSIQALVDCVHGDMNGTSPVPAMGCEIGWSFTALQYIVENGIPRDKDYPYTATTGTRCHFNESKDTPTAFFPISHAIPLPANNVTQMMSAVDLFGGFTAGITAPLEFSYWSPSYSGENILSVKSNDDCQGEGHFVTVVGYGTSPKGVDYWLVRNTFGAGWGDAGYVKIIRGVNFCHIEESPTSASASY